MARSMGRRVTVKALRKAKGYMKDDERILGESEFAKQVLGQAQEAYERGQTLQAKGIDANAVGSRVATLLKVNVKFVWSPWQKPFHYKCP